jgi:hypothetical protein
VPVIDKSLEHRHGNIIMVNWDGHFMTVPGLGRGDLEPSEAVEAIESRSGSEEDPKNFVSDADRSF